MFEARILSRIAVVVGQYDLKQGNVASLFLAVFLAWYTVTSFASYWRLRHFKGPPFAAWSGLWLINATVSAKPHLKLGDVCTQYGSLARIGPNQLLTSDEELIKKMNGARSKYSRGIWYKAFKFGAERENLLSEPDEVKHIDMRKRVFPGYTGKDSPSLEPDLDRVVFELLNLIERKYISSGADSRPIDFATISQYFTIDVITQLSLGKALGFLKNEEDMYEYSATLAKNLPVVNFISSVPSLIRFIRLPVVQKILLPSVKDKIGVGAIKGRIRDIIDDRFANGKDSRNDMVLSFIKHGLTAPEIIDESMLQLFAGSDTTSTVLRTGLVYIITNARVYKRLREEGDALNVPLSTIISNSSAIEQPYLEACIKETLRYHPAGTGMLPRVVPPEGDYHNGRFLPGGTEISFCAWNVFRHNEAYGLDYNSYRPERWLESSPEQLVKMEKAHELVFGYGRYKCLGEKIARMELFKVMFELVRRFDMTLVDSMVPVEHNENHGVFVQRGMWMRLEERKDK